MSQGELPSLAQDSRSDPEFWPPWGGSPPTYTQNSQLPCFISTFNSSSVVDGSPGVQTMCGQLQFIGGVVTESRSLTQSHRKLDSRRARGRALHRTVPTEATQTPMPGPMPRCVSGPHRVSWAQAVSLQRPWGRAPIGTSGVLPPGEARL